MFGRFIVYSSMIVTGFRGKGLLEVAKYNVSNDMIFRPNKSPIMIGMNFIEFYYDLLIVISSGHGRHECDGYHGFCHTYIP